MPESFNYGKALAESEATSRASTRDARSVTEMTSGELDAEYATAKNLSRIQQIRDEQNKRRGV